MTWIKLDDNAVDHPKVETLSDRAFRWWIKGLSYASRFLTNGLLPPVFWKKVPQQSVTELKDNRLWDWSDPNYQIHDYLAHQSSKEVVSQKKADTAERVRKFREAKRNALQVADGNALPPQVVTQPVTLPDTEIRDQIQSSENRDQNKNVPPSRPLISGESNPKTWGKIHGEHTPGFCDWVCLPDFVFDEFCRKSGKNPAKDYVRDWALRVRERYQGASIGDNLKFWRDRWAESHVAESVKPKHRGVAEIIAEREAAKGKAS